MLEKYFSELMGLQKRETVKTSYFKKGRVEFCGSVIWFASLASDFKLYPVLLLQLMVISLLVNLNIVVHSHQIYFILHVFKDIFKPHQFNLLLVHEF